MSAPPFSVSLVIFDIDGTLVDFSRAIDGGLEVVAQEVSRRAGGVEVDPRRLQALRNEVARDPAWRGRQLVAIRRESFRRILEAFAIEEPWALDELHDRYYSARDEATAVFPDAEPVLAGLHARGLPLVAASNGNVSLASMGLDGYFAARHYAEEVGISKPDPAFFASAVERAGGRPETTLAIGDRLDNDYHRRAPPACIPCCSTAPTVSRTPRSCGCDRWPSCPDCLRKISGARPPASRLPARAPPPARRPPPGSAHRRAGVW